MRAALMIGGMALLAGCDPAPPAREPTTATNSVAADGTDFQKEVAGLAPGQRNVVMVRAILDAKQECQAVVESTRQSDLNGAQRWLARCKDGQQFLVAIQGDGNAQVTGPLGKNGNPG